MKSKNRKFVIGLSALLSGAVSFTAFSYIFTKRLVKLALDRDAPRFSSKSKKRISGSIPEMLYSEEFKKAAEKFKNSDLSQVKIKASDGEILVGHLKETENPKRIIIAMHGWRSSWYKDFCKISDFWEKTDCTVLYAEQRGQSKSGGKYMGFGMIERFDCLSWINWINKITKGEIPIYLAGVSMGASTVLMASGLKLPENVSGIMADSGFTSPHEIWMHVAKNNLKLSYAVMTRVANDMCKRKINMSAKDYSTVDALKITKIPVLFIHGTDDKFVPIEMTYENYKVCASPKRLLVVPGAGHVMSYIKEPLKYQKACINFFRDFDHKKSQLC